MQDLLSKCCLKSVMAKVFPYMTLKSKVKTLVFTFRTSVLDKTIFQGLIASNGIDRLRGVEYITSRCK